MSQNENTGPNKTDQQRKKDGKVLPFRRPSPQPTLTRRSLAAKPNPLKHKKNGAPSAQAQVWKGRAFQALQIALLVTAILLALKNCGKI